MNAVAFQPVKTLSAELGVRMVLGVRVPLPISTFPPKNEDAATPWVSPGQRAAAVFGTSDNSTKFETSQPAMFGSWVFSGLARYCLRELSKSPVIMCHPPNVDGSKGPGIVLGLRAPCMMQPYGDSVASFRPQNFVVRGSTAVSLKTSLSFGNQVATGRASKRQTSQRQVFGSRVSSSVVMHCASELGMSPLLDCLDCLTMLCVRRCRLALRSLQTTLIHPLSGHCMSILRHRAPCMMQPYGDSVASIRPLKLVVRASAAVSPSASLAFGNQVATGRDSKSHTSQHQVLGPTHCAGELSKSPLLDCALCTALAGPVPWNHPHSGDSMSVLELHMPCMMGILQHRGIATWQRVGAQVSLKKLRGIQEKELARRGAFAFSSTFNSLISRAMPQAELVPNLPSLKVETLQEVETKTAASAAIVLIQGGARTHLDFERIAGHVARVWPAAAASIPTVEKFLQHGGLLSLIRQVLAFGPSLMLAGHSLGLNVAQTVAGCLGCTGIKVHGIIALDPRTRGRRFPELPYMHRPLTQALVPRIRLENFEKAFESPHVPFLSTPQRELQQPSELAQEAQSVAEVGKTLADTNHYTLKETHIWDIAAYVYAKAGRLRFAAAQTIVKAWGKPRDLASPMCLLFDSLPLSHEFHL